jgi:hypothetical protein
MKLQMILLFGVLVRGMYNGNSGNIRNRLIAENQIQTTERDVFYDTLNVYHPELTGEQLHEGDVFYDTFPKLESNGANYEVEEGNLIEYVVNPMKVCNRNVRNNNIEELVTEASLLTTQYDWTTEDIRDLITQTYYCYGESTRIDRCKELIKETLIEEINNVMVDADNKLKQDQIRRKFKELFTDANGNQLTNVEDLNDDSISFYDSTNHSKSWMHTKPYEMKVDAFETQKLLRDSLNWKLNHNDQGLKLTQKCDPFSPYIEDKILNYLTLREQLRVGETCVKIYNRHCAKNQHFTVSTSLASKCQCGFRYAAECKCDKNAPYGFYLMPPVDKFDKTFICLYSKENEDLEVDVNLCLEDGSGDFKKYYNSKGKTSKITFEIWKLPNNKGFKGVNGCYQYLVVSKESVARNYEDLESPRLFKIENLSWGQKNEPVEMEIHLYKNKKD